MGTQNPNSFLNSNVTPRQYIVTGVKLGVKKHCPTYQNAILYVEFLNLGVFWGKKLTFSKVIFFTFDYQRSSVNFNNFFFWKVYSLGSDTQKNVSNVHTFITTKF